MSANLQVASKQDIKGLVAACSSNQGEDAFSQSVTPAHWAQPTQRLSAMPLLQIGAEIMIA